MCALSMNPTYGILSLNPCECITYLRFKLKDAFFFCISFDGERNHGGKGALDSVRIFFFRCLFKCGPYRGEAVLDRFDSTLLGFDLYVYGVNVIQAAADFFRCFGCFVFSSLECFYFGTNIDTS